MQHRPPWFETLLTAERLDDDFPSTFDRVHKPIAQQILAHARCRGGTLLVGICGAQGSGKSTMTLVLEQLIRDSGLSVASMSLDDLYHTRAHRARLARDVHPLLETRGVPGTHDVALGTATLAALREPGAVSLPAFDKARDDRRPMSEWRRATSPVDVILFEGWCVGAKPQPTSALELPVNELERVEDGGGVWRRYVNEALASRYRTLFDPVDLLIVLQAPSFEVVRRWRLEQELKLLARAGEEAGESLRVMDEAAIGRFVQHFERLTRHMLTDMPARADILVPLDELRRLAPPLGRERPAAMKGGSSE